MPKKATAEVLLAMSPRGAAAALGIPYAAIQRELDLGNLVCRQYGQRKRIAVFGPKGLQAFYESWPVADRRKSP